MAQLDLTDVELKMLDLMIAVKQKSDASKGDFISDIFEAAECVGHVAEVAVAVTEATGGATALSEALSDVHVPGSGISLDGLLQIRKKAVQQ